MTILIPMAGEGKRFSERSYTEHKPVIPVTDYRTGNAIPMVVAAVKDLPVNVSQSRLIFIDRDFHVRDGVEETLKQHFPHASFITTTKLTQGQASTCLLAETALEEDEPLCIGACDNGMITDASAFHNATQKYDALIFTFRHNVTVARSPQSYGWVRCAQDDTTAIEISVKKPISTTPLNDHAIVGTFWFRHSKYFVQAAKEMIAQNDRINNEFYIDKAMQYLIQKKLKVAVYEISRYLCWGTPEDYEAYEKTLHYWNTFVKKETWI